MNVAQQLGVVDGEVQARIAEEIEIDRAAKREALESALQDLVNCYGAPYPMG